MISGQENQKLLVKLAGICSFLGALTTILLIFLPNPQMEGFEATAQLHTNRLYLTKQWILFLHPQFNFIASIGVGLILYKRFPLQISIGLLFLFLWMFTEMTQQALSIDALNQIWRPGYLEATENDKLIYETLIRGQRGISDSQYFIVIYGFGLGTLFFGLAFINLVGLAQYLGYGFIFIGVLSLCSFLRYYLGIGFLNEPVNWLYTWVYPYLQPLVRIGLGLWLLRSLHDPHSNQTTSAPREPA